MPFIDISAVEGHSVPRPFARELKILLSPDTDPAIKDFSFLVSTLAPGGGCTDWHSHEKEGELMIFMTGTGRAWLDGVEYAIRPGTAMYAPPGSVHRTMNTGEEPLMIACVFTPAVSTDYIIENVRAARKRGVEE